MAVPVPVPCLVEAMAQSTSPGNSGHSVVLATEEPWVSIYRLRPYRGDARTRERCTVLPVK